MSVTGKILACTVWQGARVLALKLGGGPAQERYTTTASLPARSLNAAAAVLEVLACLVHLCCPKQLQTAYTDTAAHPAYLLRRRSTSMTVLLVDRPCHHRQTRQDNFPLRFVP